MTGLSQVLPEGLLTIGGCLSLSFSKDICPPYCWAQARSALLLEASYFCITFAKVEPMWSLPLWVTCFQTEVCSRSTWQAEPQSHACLNLQGWLGKLISDLCLGKVLTHHGRNSPNTSWWSKELNVNKNDGWTPLEVS